MSDATALIHTPAFGTHAQSVLRLHTTPWGPSHPAAAYLASLGSVLSQATMRHALDLAAELMTDGRADAETLPWASLTSVHTAALHARLLRHRVTRRRRGMPPTSKALSPASANKVLAAVRGVLRKAWELNLTDRETVERAVAALKRVRGRHHDREAGREVVIGERQALLVSCTREGTPQGVRDAALLTVLYAGGLRRAEAAALRIEDVDVHQCALRVQGKGNKVREVFLSPRAMTFVQQWLACRAELLRGEGPREAASVGPLFLPLPKRVLTTCPGWRLSQAGIRAMTPQAIYAIVRRRATEAGVASLSPHDLRRTFIGDLLDAGADIAVAAALAGHASVTTTARYDRRGRRARRRAASLLDVGADV